MTLTIRQSSKQDLIPDTIATLVSLINDVYAEAEGDLWKPDNTGRTNNEEVEKFIKNGLLFFAELKGKIVGSVKIEHVDDQTLGFGMLVANPDCRGEGIGRELVNHVENHARNHGYSIMQLELLTPRHWKNPSKEFLKAWYTRIGYKATKTRPFGEISPQRMDEFATDCDFTIWLKDLN
jgi:GNAT superfamily N-acetyltransferase